MKIGFFGGSFNPPTKAHINLAKKALNICKLDKVIFVPMGDIYEKKGLVKAEHRYNMLKIVCEKEIGLEVSDLEIKAKEKMYAIDAFKLIEKAYPYDEKYYIIGADNFINLLNWKNSKELIEKYEYIVLERKNIDIKTYIEKNLKEYIKKIYIIENEEHRNCSSSLFRQGLNKDMVEEEVLAYIEGKGLFK